MPNIRIDTADSPKPQKRIRGVTGAALAVSLLLLSPSSLPAEPAFPPSYAKIFSPKRCTDILRYDAFHVCYSEWARGPLTVGYWIDGSKVDDVRYLEYAANWSFYLDPNIDPNFQAHPEDFQNSTMAPVQLRSYRNTAWDYNLMYQTFDMVNVIPLLHYIDKKVWPIVQQFTREMALDNGGVNVMDMVIYPKKEVLRLGRHGVAVPSGVYRIIYTDGLKVNACLYIPNKKPDPHEVEKAGGEAAYLDSYINTHLIDCETVDDMTPPGEVAFYKEGISEMERMWNVVKEKVVGFFDEIKKTYF